MWLVQENPPIYALEAHDTSFPDPSQSDEEGLVCVGVDFRYLLEAYKKGIFPWFIEEGIIYWFSPDPRMILDPHDFRLTRSLKQSIRHRGYEVRVNTAFRHVMEGCKNTRNNSWITDYYIESYTDLFEQGYAMSVETYYKNKLVGGLYGVRLGEMLCGESMFSTMKDASKVAMAYLCTHADEWGITFIDCQVPNDHLRTLGAKEMPRNLFLEKLATTLAILS